MVGVGRRFRSEVRDGPIRPDQEGRHQQVTTKEWLMQYKIAKIAAERCFQDLDAATVVLKSPSLTGMPRGGTERDLADIVAMQERIRERATKARDKALRLMDEISKAIEQVEDPTQQMLLWMRYIYCRNWYDIADAMHMSMRSVHYLHAQALRNIAHDCTE